MKLFLDQDFLLDNETARLLYHEYAKDLPVIDYHSHLPPRQIAENTGFENITQVWLNGDHYKWRAMRSNGINEFFITGGATDWEKFQKWAETVPYTMRNPLYHWTHLELQRYFGIHKLLSPETAKEIYAESAEKLKLPAFSVQNLLRKMNLKLLCTTDDPADGLEYHQQLKKGFEIPVLPAFRPDLALSVDSPVSFNQYLEKLQGISSAKIENFNDFVSVLKTRHDYFAENGCTVSDHGLEALYADDYTEKEIILVFDKIRSNRLLLEEEKRKFKSCLLSRFAEWNWEKGWVQQYHLGALRNNNSRMSKTLGTDTGWDSIGDFQQIRPLAKFLDRLDSDNKLTKTILYNINPADNEQMATMIGNFNDGSMAGKIQWGSAWWFLDQKEGMTKQINALSNMGLVSRFIGMLTDSRSFLSYPRHEYFRRILCNLFGMDMENGELPNDKIWIGKLIQDICFNNARNYFGWSHLI
jgi:glucuronate isomerase